MTTLPLRRLIALGVAALAVVCSPAAFGAALIAPQLARSLAQARADTPLQVIVTYDSQRPLRTAQLDGLRNLGLKGIALSRLPMVGVLATPAQIQQIAQLPGVRSVYPNKRLEYLMSEARVVTSVDQAAARPALRGPSGEPYTGKGVTIFINDSGIDGTHPDLKFGTKVTQNVVGHLGLVNGLLGVKLIPPIENVPNSDVLGSHGTHVAGIAAGDGSASDGKYRGVASGANLIGYGSGAAILVLDSLGGFDYALKTLDEHPEYNLRVLNASFGDPSDVGTAFDPEDPTNIATKMLADRGVIVVFAAGNSGPGQDTLSGQDKKAPWVVVAANGDKRGLLAATSSRGSIAKQWPDVTVDGETFSIVDRPTVVAPGTEIVSTRALALDPLSPLDTLHDLELGDIASNLLLRYTHKSGTSMAAPHIAGLVAILLEANPDLTWREIKPILEKSSTNMTGYAPWQTGAGYVNAEAALAMALGLRKDYGRTVNVLRTFNSVVGFGGSEEATHDIAFRPIGPTGDATFEVGANVSLVAASWSQPLGNLCTCAVVLIDPNGEAHGSAIALPELSPAVSTSAPGMPGTWHVTVRGIGSVSGIALDPLGVTNGIAGIGTASVHVTQFLAGQRVGLDDIEGHRREAFIEAAVSARLADGLGDGRFHPDHVLTRAQLAQYLVSGFGVRQNRPFDRVPLFSDVSKALAPYAEMVSARGALIHTLDVDAKPPMLAAANDGQFSPGVAVTRQAAAYALVQSLGLQAEAEAFSGDLHYTTGTGQIVAIADQAAVAPRLRGYVQKALDLGLLVPFLQHPDPTTTIARFRPKVGLDRGTWAEAAVQASTYQQSQAVDQLGL